MCTATLVWARIYHITHNKVYCGGKSDNCSTIEITHMSFCLVCSVVSTLTRNLLLSSVMSKIDEVVYVEHSSMKAGFGYSNLLI